jgi:hypothetical protein
MEERIQTTVVDMNHANKRPTHDSSVLFAGRTWVALHEKKRA